MKALIVYDSFFGNTEKVARAIGNALGVQENDIVRVSTVKPEQLAGVNVLIVGSPTRAFRPTKAIVGFLNRIPLNSLNGITVAGFDTRISIADSNSRILNIMVNFFGYAAKPIADKLRKKGGELKVPPEGFFVKDSEGPLKDGELERAASWARQIKE
jgi:flavodoxin I